jgi:hypothetical protein
MKATAGGAISIKRVGISFSGSGLWKINLFSITEKRSIQNINPILKKNQFTIGETKATPATGTTRFPRIGMNQDGFA